MIFPKVPKNCMKLKEFGSRGGDLDPPLPMMHVMYISTPLTVTRQTAVKI